MQKYSESLTPKRKLTAKDFHNATPEYADSPAADTGGRTIDTLFPPREESSIVSVACHPGDYSASRIAHAVEDCDAHLLNLNVTSLWLPAGEMVVELRVSHRNPSRVIRSLERYGYPVVSFTGNDEEYTGGDIMRDRVNELIRILDT